MVIDENGDDSFICGKCDRPVKFSRSKGHRRNLCNACRAKNSRARLKAKAVEYRGGKCMKCGYTRCHRALEFHHRDREDKEFTVAMMMNASWERIRKELDKCDLLCRNCHAETEHELSGL
jgi:Zn ribbon nucleic-acid-binding protein